MISYRTSLILKELSCVNVVDCVPKLATYLVMSHAFFSGVTQAAFPASIIGVIIYYYSFKKPQNRLISVVVITVDFDKQDHSLASRVP
jgi:hypothetical protein